MRRREFIAGAAAATATSLARQGRAWQTGTSASKMKRVAMFHPSEPPEGMTVNGRRSFKAYFAELNRLGYVEGRNFILEQFRA